MAELPLKFARLVTLSLANAFGVIGGSVGLNSIIKRNQAVARIKHEVAPLGIKLTVDTFDLLRPGVVLAVGCSVLGVVTSVWLSFLFLDILKSRKSSNVTFAYSKPPISTRTLTWQWMSLAFMTVWILACDIPVIYIAVNNAAKTTAYLGSTQLPHSVVEARERALGVNPAYWSNDYVRLQVIPPWATFLFSLLATIVTYSAAKRSHVSKVSHGEKQSVESEPEAMSSVDPEKPTEVKREIV